MRSMVLTMILLTGCAGSYKASYVTGATTKQFATESYDIYSESFNKKVSECDPDNNESVTTKSELDQCMDGFSSASHDKIEIAAKVYHESAKIHTAIMSSIDASPEERIAATKQVVKSAIALLELFPDGEKLASKLSKLVGGI